MNKSESIGALALALSKLQGEIQNLAKEKDGYGYKYVELGAILDEVRPLLLKNELAVTQLCQGMSTVRADGSEDFDDEYIGIESVLMHSSGEWLSSIYYMKIEPKKGLSMAQSAGMVITYARRYALAALLGIAQVDDDATVKEIIPPTPKEPTMHDKLYATLMAFVDEYKLHDNIEKWKQHFKVKHLESLSETQLSKLIETIKENANG